MICLPPPLKNTIFFSSHCMFCCSPPISAEAPVFRGHICFYFAECSSLFRAVTPVWGLVHPQTKELPTQCAHAETAWHIPSHYAAAFLFSFSFFFREGCRAAAAQFRNIRQEQMKRTCLLVGGKCQLLHIHQQRHCLFSLEVIASFSPWFWAIVEKAANRIVILKPTASLSTSAPQANLIVGKKKKVTRC